MTLEEFLYEALLQARKSGPLSKERWLAVAKVAIVEHKIANKKAPRAKVSRQNNPLFDALALATGTQDVKQITRNAAKITAVALADIKEVCPTLTVAEIHRVVDAYKRRHPMWSCTPTAIAKHWAEFAQASRTATARTDVYQEPPDWKTSDAARLAVKASPETWQVIIERGWFDLATDIRADILRGLNSV